jgi:hypothetical protein
MRVCTYTRGHSEVVGEESGQEIVDSGRWVGGWGGDEAVLKSLEGFVPAVAMRGSGQGGGDATVLPRGRVQREEVLDGSGQIANGSPGAPL